MWWEMFLPKGNIVYSNIMVLLFTVSKVDFVSLKNSKLGRRRTFFFIPFISLTHKYFSTVCSINCLKMEIYISCCTLWAMSYLHGEASGKGFNSRWSLTFKTFKLELTFIALLNQFVAAQIVYCSINLLLIGDYPLSSQMSCLKGNKASVGAFNLQFNLQFSRIWS